MTELEEIKGDIKAIKSEVESLTMRNEIAAIKVELDEIRDNHLAHIYNAIESLWGAIGFLTKGVSDLKWLIIGASGLLALVIALCALLS